MKDITNYLLAAACAVALVPCVQSCSSGAKNSDCLVSNDEYAVYRDRVIQGDFEAVAVSPTEITTNYKSALDGDISSVVEFRFAFNSRDNELPAGKLHYADLANYNNDKVYVPGEPQDAPEVAFTPMANDTEWTVKLDMAPVLGSFRDNGYYVTATGDTIFSDDFKGVVIIGNVYPLNWEFENQLGNPQRELKPSAENPEVYELTVSLNPVREAPLNAIGWKVDSLPSAFPQVSTGSVLADAVYNMGVDDIISDIRPDDTFRAGYYWDGVWTRDVSYSIYLSLAYLDPVRSMNSLRFKVKRDRIIQDTGSGGSWPVSTDRIVWATAAWEIYTATGDKEWLEYAYNVIKNSISDDEFVVLDKSLGLMHGEQSYLDWREQTYPKWMQTKDIYESMTLGTNVLFAHAYDILAGMANQLGEDATGWESKAANLKQNINKYLWMPESGYYGQYLYTSPYPIISNSVDNLGQSIAVIFNVASDEMAKSIISNTPITTFGTTSIYPMLPNIKPYHNNAVWPFVQSYWNLAAAKAGNATALCNGIGSVYRAAAMYATNKELFVASTGDFRGTAINSDKQLWSAAGNVSTVFRIYAGMNFEPEGIRFAPVVPEFFSDSIAITNFKYRNATLSVTVVGSGNKVKSITLDGVECDGAFVDGNIEGDHAVRIVMEGKCSGGKVNLQPVEYMPLTPNVAWTGSEAVIDNYTEEDAYRFYVNGSTTEELISNSMKMPESVTAGKCLSAVNFVPVSKGLVGFASATKLLYPSNAAIELPISRFAKPGTSYITGEKALQYVETTVEKNTDIAIAIDAPEAGEYFVDVRYCNGNGPISTENKCAIRTLMVNGDIAGPIVMPQRGVDEWLNPGYSNILCVKLNKGMNDVHIKYLVPMNVNMNVEQNTALLRSIRFIRK